MCDLVGKEQAEAGKSFTKVCKSIISGSEIEGSVD